MSDAPKDTLLGFITKSRYAYYTYMLVVGASVVGLVLSLLALVGIYLGPIGNLVALAGLAGVVLALLGAFVFKDEFSALDHSHFIFISIVYVVTWVAAVFFGSALAFVYILAQIVVLAISIAATVLLYTGYVSWKGGRTITKDNIQSEVRLALKRP